MATGVRESHDRIVDTARVRLSAPFLILDAFAVSDSSPIPQVFLAALGMAVGGAPRYLALTTAGRADDAAWGTFLRSLREDGNATHPLLICCDGDWSQIRAIQATFPETPMQISVVHRLVALARTMNCKWPTTCLAEARRIFLAPSREAAVARFREWRRRCLRPENHGQRAVRSLETDLAQCLNFYRFPPHLWRRIRTVSPVGRFFRTAQQFGLLAAVDAAEGGSATEEPMGPSLQNWAAVSRAGNRGWRNTMGIRVAGRCFYPSIRLETPSGVLILDWIQRNPVPADDSVTNPPSSDNGPS